LVASNHIEESLKYMPQIAKEDCLTLDQAREKLGISKGTFYTYLNYLNVQRHKFAFDRRAYIHRNDLARLQDFIRSNRG
jgi:ACT domain-containing protein